jgi:hypothetical protein
MPETAASAQLQQGLRQAGPCAIVPALRCDDLGTRRGLARLDCDTSTDGEAIKRIDLYSYALTDQAETLLTRVETPPIVPAFRHR